MTRLSNEVTQRIPQLLLTLSRAVDECKPLVPGVDQRFVPSQRGGGTGGGGGQPRLSVAGHGESGAVRRANAAGGRGGGQGLTIVHFSAERKQILWDTLAA